MHRFTFYDYFLTFISTTTYIADFATDVAVIVYFFTYGYQVWGSLCMSFVALAALTMLVFSFHWQVTERTLSCGSLILHLCFLAPTYRYIQIFHLGRKSRKSGSSEDLAAVCRAMNDVSLLRMFAAFLESVPLLILQLYIVLSNLDNFNTLIGFSTVFSLISLSWSVVAYMDTLHLAAKKFYKRCFTTLLTNMVWQCGMITARIVSILLFSTALGGYVGIPIALHFITMMIWFSKLQPKHEAGYCERHMSSVLLSVVHILLFLKQKDGSSRYRMTFFYILTLVETGVFMVIWYMFKPYDGPIWFDVSAFSVVFGSFGLGALFMLLYYGCCHPSGPAPLPKQHKQQGFLKPRDNRYHGYTTSHKSEPQKPPKDYQNSKPSTKNPAIFDVSSTSARINLWLSASLDLSKEGLVENPDSHLDPSIQQRGGHQYNTFGGRSVHNSSAHERNMKNVRSPKDSIVSPNSSNSYNSSIKPLLGQSLQTSCVGRPGGWETSYSDINKSGNRLDYSHASKMTGGEHSLPDYNIVEMFSRCKLDPSFVSNESISEILFNQTLKRESVDGNIGVTSLSPSQYPQSDLPRFEQNNSITAIDGQNWNHSRVSNNSSKSLIVSNRSTPDRDLTLGTKPMKISPLDPSKLWEESEQRLDSMVSPNSYLCNNEIDTIPNRSKDKTAVLTITPDESRGITHLSLSYSDLNGDQKSGSGNSILKGEVNKSVESLNDHSNNRSHSKLLSFSDESLQLPDNSYNNSRNRSNSHQDSMQSGSQTNHTGPYSDRLERKSSEYGIRSLDRGGKTRSVDSFNSRECSSDTQPSYLSDRGLASSDHALSSSASTNDIYGQRSMTSSGFQSEESNLSVTSPKHKFYSKYLQQQQSQAKPLVENEISSISQPVTTSMIRNKRVSLDQDIYADSETFKNSTPIIEGTKASGLNADDITPIIRGEPKNRDTELLPSSLFNFDVTSSKDSPTLPPIGWSRTSSSNSGRRFFEDLTDTSCHDGMKSNEDNRENRSNMSSYVETPSYMERSSLSVLLSDMSSFKNGGNRTSSETVSSQSDIDSLKRSTNSNSVDLMINRTTSLPYIPQNKLSPCLTPDEVSASLPHIVNSRQSLDKSLDSIHEYENIENYSSQNGSGSSSASLNVSGGRIVSDYLCNTEPEKTRMQELFNEYSSLKESTEKCKVSDYMNIGVSSDLGNRSQVNEGQGEQARKSRNWRNSIDKQTTESLINDIEKLAPKKLYQLQSKSAVAKKLSPVKISDYADSPYKFRKSNERKSLSGAASDYENIRNFDQNDFNGSPYKVRQKSGLSGNIRSNKKGSVDSINTEISLNSSRLYENIDVLSSKIIGNCPIASPESLSDALLLDDLLPRQQAPSNQTYSIIEKVHSELDNVSPWASLESQSVELSRNKSPINTSGVNSAFKPVKNRQSVDSQSSCSDHSRMTNSSSSTLDSGVYKSCHSNVSSRNGSSNEENVFVPEKSGHFSDSLQYSCNTENVSSFQWIQNTGVSMTTGLSESVDQTPRNYLRMSITPPSCLNVLNSDNASQSSKHSYTDSIPWEDSVNKSANSSMGGVNSSVGMAPKQRPRQPLKSLENTPVFSPIYGNDNVHGVELSSRARYMSTPKLSSAQELSTSKTSEDSFGGIKTPCRASTGRSNRTNSNNTSTWSSQCDSDISDHMGHSTFALSKTTYI
ncbi:XK [Mactra antiquata]